MPENVNTEPTRPQGYVAAWRDLARSQKSSVRAAAYSRFVNRKLGRLIAAGAFVLRMTPNQVTVVSALFTFTAVALIALVHPSVGVAVLIAILLVLGYAFDSADGQLARLRGGGNLVGEYLDHVVDAVKSSALHAAVLIGWYRFFGLGHTFLLVPLGFMIVSAVMFFSTVLADMMRRVRKGDSAMILSRPGSTSLLYSLAVVPGDYGLLCVIFFIYAWIPGFVVVYSAIFVLTTIMLVLALARWLREMSRLSENS